MVKIRGFWVVALLFALVAGASAQTTLRFGVLPDASSLPFQVAEAEGLFAAQGLKVELTLFQSAVERDAAFQAGQIDGTIGDILAAALAVDHGFGVKITSVCDGRFGLVVAPGSQARTPKDLAGQPIGVSLHTIIHYFVDTTLTQAGVPASQVRYLAVPKLPVRLEMLAGGQLAAAAMPEPLLSVAQARGGQVIATSEGNPSAASVVLFSDAYLGAHRATLQAFYAAVDQASARINAKADAYRDFLVQKVRFPAAIRDSYRFDTYTPAHLPEAAAVTRVLGWLKDQALITGPLTAPQLLDGRRS